MSNCTIKSMGRHKEITKIARKNRRGTILHTQILHSHDHTSSSKSTICSKVSNLCIHENVYIKQLFSNISCQIKKITPRDYTSNEKIVNVRFQSQRIKTYEISAQIKLTFLTYTTSTFFNDYVLTMVILRCRDLKRERPEKK